MTVGLSRWMMSVLASTVAIGSVIVWRVGKIETATDALTDEVRAGQLERTLLRAAIDRLSEQLSRTEVSQDGYLRIERFQLWIERTRLKYPDIPDIDH
jgi:hypothetical protein